MSNRFTGPVLCDPPAGDIRRLLQLRRSHALTSPVNLAQLAKLWGCSQLLATARLARFNRLRMAEVRQLSPSTFLVLPRRTDDTPA